MDHTTDRTPPDGPGEPKSPRGWRRWKPSTATAWVLAVVIPIVLFIVTQLDVVQDADGWFIRDLTSWDLGKKDIVADILAPIWVVSIVVVAALERRMLRYYADAPNPPDATPVPILHARQGVCLDLGRHGRRRSHRRHVVEPGSGPDSASSPTPSGTC